MSATVDLLLSGKDVFSIHFFQIFQQFLCRCIRLRITGLVRRRRKAREFCLLQCNRVHNHVAVNRFEGQGILSLVKSNHSEIKIDPVPGHRNNLCVIRTVDRYSLHSSVICDELKRPCSQFIHSVFFYIYCKGKILVCEVHEAFSGITREFILIHLGDQFSFRVVHVLRLDGIRKLRIGSVIRCKCRRRRHSHHHTCRQHKCHAFLNIHTSSPLSQSFFTGIPTKRFRYFLHQLYHLFVLLSDICR